ncbi:hypothetical protein [Dyella sp.]|uniref:hypothetical protein n=1 Tax=Dyella sp. TaxID=1869338 RepID=UPI00284EC8E7|nr:hypothetical protein [Dyella sp.]MDR3445972.1 hypothetical protein [Dyella sp.]
MSTTSEKRHMARVAQLTCGLCGATGVQVHHIRAGQGMSERASDFLTVPVCPSCHTGPKGIHGDKTMLRIKKWDELDLLADTLRRLAA